ncbi:hypothetical protein A3J44_02970 [candidate division WOR-1 bacterium RIFCSPHIGHO2_02_FULL_45_12]|nr:MAG: hypothetical protein A3J44_02970 [candidate division WOR-1 bacterium RIFCSPHIGHO2_02_FULL_45_12]OGX46379.1 MAG: hypothetical protein A3G38_00105 [Omnitrophica WOR_2 bacterium RIFCSPLOWO2_12_FULL_51_8]
MAFKTDVSFLEKISIGATGTRRVFEDLKRLGHRPVELERGSMSFKIWKEIKIKRVRVPDVLCVGCGRRVESRAKTKLLVTMSHSVVSPERGWDFGLDDGDMVAFVKCSKIGTEPVDWAASGFVQYVSAKPLRAAVVDKKVFWEKPKGTEEGFEARITWPSAVASCAGEVVEVGKERLKLKRRGDGRLISLALEKKGIRLKPLVKAGDVFVEDQILASVVPVSTSFDCGKGMEARDYVRMIRSASLSDRYGAAKALSFFKGADIHGALVKKTGDARDHIYIRLEAAASLLKMGFSDSVDFFKSVLADEYLENRLECVIILGEICSDVSCRLLIEVLLDKAQHSEIRAGAAWALGELKNKVALDALVSVFDDIDLGVRSESARALFRLSGLFGKEIIKYFPKGSEDVRAGISWALSKSGNFSVKDLLSVMADDGARKWVAWVVGTQKQEKLVAEIEDLKDKDKEVYFAVTVLWKILSSWVGNLEIY